MNPFELWTGMLRDGAAITRTGFQLAETMQASHAVIDQRSRTIASACRDPLSADYAELGRMVPEKVAAFSQAGAAALDDFHAIQNETLAHWQQLMSIGLRGRLPTGAEMAAMTARSARVATRGAAAAGKALAPIHRTATANARRLQRGRPR